MNIIEKPSIKITEIDGNIHQHSNMGLRLECECGSIKQFYVCGLTGIVNSVSDCKCPITTMELAAYKESLSEIGFVSCMPLHCQVLLNSLIAASKASALIPTKPYRSFFRHAIQ